MTDELRDSVADATDGELRAVVEPWMQSDELQSISPTDVTADDSPSAPASDARPLSQRITHARQHLYLFWME